MARRFSWPDEFQGAVSLTYDDGLPVHCDLVGPLLRQYGLHATFYPMIQSDLRLRPERWKELAAAGHELGNHSLFHPCRQRSQEPYAWLDERYDLAHYSLAQIRAELEVANLVLHLLDGQRARSYGSTCGDLSVGPEALKEPLEPLLKALFVAARGTLTNQAAQPALALDLYNIDSIDVGAHSLQGLQDLIERTRATGGWAVLVIHGVGAGTHEIHLETDTHEGFIRWLAQQGRIWTAPVREIAAFIRDRSAAPGMRRSGAAEA